MKSLKMLGLAALAALLAMAFVGASSAMAESTELCYGDPSGGTCPTGYEALTSVHEESVGKAKLLASPRVECNVLFESTNVGAAGAPQVIRGHFKYTNCGCTVEERPLTTAEIRVLRTGHETAEVTGNARIIVDCFGIKCTYNGEGLKGTALGPLLSTEANGEVNLNEQEVRGSGTFCPERGKLDIKTTPLLRTYIGRGGALHYCVEYEKAEAGFYTSLECNVESSTRNQKFMLVVGAAACYEQVRTPRGLWRRVNAVTGECEENDATNRSTFERWLFRRTQ